MTAEEILEALIARADDMIWATELSFDYGKSRIDFFTLAPIPSVRFATAAYEIKVSRADFKRDSEKKQAGALKWSNRFWYVTPPGLIDVSELPDWAGLQEFTGKLFRIKRKAPPSERPDPDWPFVISLLRNSGETRRDYGLLKAQLAFYQAQVERFERRHKLKNQMRMQRWLEKHAPEVAAGDRGPECLGTGPRADGPCTERGAEEPQHEGTENAGAAA